MASKMANFFGRSPKHPENDPEDISQSMENISLNLSAMDVDSFRDTNSNLYPSTTAPLRQYDPRTNKENITPASSPTKSILHNSPGQINHQSSALRSPFHNNLNQNMNQHLNQHSNQYSNQNPNQSPIQNQGVQPFSSLHPPPPPSTSPLKFDEEFYRKVDDPKTKRLASVAQLFFLDYYCDMFDYVISRRERAKLVEHKLLSDPEFTNNNQRQQMEWKNYVGRERALLRKRRLKPKVKDFQMITQVGQGGYGQVFLARKKDTREVCALKILNKKLLMKLDETRHVLTERDILTNTRLDWLVRLLYAFQDPEKVFLAMEFVPGGDFRTLLNNSGYLIPPHARFYILEMFCAVNALHELGFTHRDLKPENFLIDLKGHIKLTDFGLAAGTVSSDRIESMRIKLQNLEDLDNYKVPSISMVERQRMFRQSQLNAGGHRNLANSIVGLPDYMALEVLEGKNYDYTIDYWSLGCMLFEALCGYPPFSGSKLDETYHNLKNWKTALRRPQTKDGRFVFSDRTWNLITKLIASPTLRLRSFKQIQNQPYFSDIRDWDHMRERPPPFTPQLDNEEDAGYFDDFEDEESMKKYKDVFARQEHNELLLGKGQKIAGANNFIGFTFKHKLNPNNKIQGEINLLLLTANRLDPLATLY